MNQIYLIQVFVLGEIRVDNILISRFQFTQRQIVGVGRIHFTSACGLNPPLNLGFGIINMTQDLETNTRVGSGVVTGDLANWSGPCPNLHVLLCMTSCLVLLQIDRQTHRLDK